MSIYGVGLNTEVNNINTQLKLHIARYKGGVTFRTLKQIFRQYDFNGNNKLEYEEFQQALNGFGFFLKNTQYQTLHKFYDQNRDGSIDFQEFMRGLREPLSERRLKLVLKIYDILDTNQNGVLTVEDLQNTYDVSKHPEVVKGTKSKDQVLTEFLNNFERDNDGKVTRNEFVSYYEDLSVALPSDSYFVEVLCNAWGVEEDEESIVTEQEVKNIVKILRYKLIQMTNGISDEFLLKKIFQEFDYDKTGYLNLEELYALTIKLEVPIHRKYLSALLKKFDRNGTGYIEFDEFLYFITYDPYP